MKSLQALDFVDSRNKPLDGLVPVDNPTQTQSPHERAVLLEIEAFEHIDYVYFRRFKAVNGNTARSSQVAAYVIDNSRRRLNKNELAELHHKLWLHAVAPLVYVGWPTRVDILSCARKPDFWNEDAHGPRETYSPAESILTAADVSDELAKRRRCSAYRLADGTFWDEPENQKLAREDAAAHRSLIQAIVEADKQLKGAQNPLRRRLLVLMILIKYLEDRGVFPTWLFGRFHAGARSFLDILETGTVAEVSRLLDYFERRFNGDVFSLGGDEKELTKKELQSVANLVEGRTLGGQKHFWELYRFEHIPVEVISRLYQRFVTGHGAVYTPPFLAALLLDQVMPFEKIKGDEKICDFACGSGVFLVGAFKRLVTHWRSNHQWTKPSVENLKGILARSIHGVEMESGAVDLTAFSLAIALCDALEPPVIWKSLTFEKLRGRNLREGDFFDPATTADSSAHTWPKNFDVVVGNPPFESKLTKAAKAVDKNRPKKELKLPDKQVAYLFLERSLRLLSPGGSACLVQPHGLLYNSKTAAFRRHLLGLARLDTVLDFVSIRGMFDEKDAKTVAWHAMKDDSFDEPIKHLTFRRTYSVSEKISFEIDHYDWHEITHQQAKKDSFVWRINLLGGGRLQDISVRLRQLTTLAALVAERGWDFGEGFILGNRARKAPYLNGLPLLPTKAFTDSGIDESRLTRLNESHFDSPRNPDRFTAPLMLIKEHTSLPVAFWDKGPLAYRDKIVGIHAPAPERKGLLAVHETLESRKPIFRFCSTLHGSQGWVGKATAILKQDIDRLPMPDDPTALDLCYWEEILKEDVLMYMGDYVRLGQGSGLLKQEAKLDDVRKYSSLYRRMLGSLYRNLKAGHCIRLNGLIAQPFYFGKAPDVSWLGENCQDALHRLIYEETGEALRTARVVRYYDSNVILIVKPDRLRYWIRSTAIRDADDTLIDLREQGL